MECRYNNCTYKTQEENYVKSTLYYRTPKPLETSYTLKMSEKFIEEYKKSNPDDEVTVLELYKEDIVSASIEDPGVAADEVKLGDDEYFVLGDNRNSSEDSRMANIGNVKKDYIIGKAWFHFKGFGKMGLID